MDGESVFFEAVVVPHRSLSRRGLWVLIGAIGTMSAIASTVFWLLGAWPVAVFNGAELTLAALLLRYNARAARANEVILMSPSGVRIIRTAANGARTEQALPVGWLRIDWQERKGRVPGLFLASRHMRVEVGASLGEPEKSSLADGLRSALDNWRRPRFDNPQLQD